MQKCGELYKHGKTIRPPAWPQGKDPGVVLPSNLNSQCVELYNICLPKWCKEDLVSGNFILTNW